MPRTLAIAALLGTIACGRGEPVPDDPPRPAGSSGAIPPAAVSATLALPPAGSAAGSAAASAPPTGGAEAPRALVRDGGLVLSSAGLPEAVVRRIVRQNFGRLRLCYQVAALADPTIAGDVVILFRIDASGAVTGARDAGSTAGSPDLVACAQRTFASLSFPSPTPAPVDVTYTVYFAPAPAP